MRRAGLVLVGVLGIVVLLGAMAAVVAAVSRNETRMCLAEMEAIRAKWAARAGVEKALAILDYDDPATDTLFDVWANNPEELLDIQLDGCILSIELVDEQCKLNVNIATRDMLMELDGMTDEIADSILDWRDEDDEVREYGAEAGYYLNLQYPYHIRNGPFRTVGELLMVKGVGREHFYGEAPQNATAAATDFDPWINSLTVYGYEQNRSAEGRRRINVNRSNERILARRLDIPASYARWIVENRGGGFANIGHLITDASPQESQGTAGRGEGSEPLDRRTFIEISDSITTDSGGTMPGKVNINTVGRTVLVALLEGDEDLADRILMARDGSLLGFQNVGELLDVDGMTVEKFRSIVDLVTVRSNVFRITCTVISDRTGARYTYSAVVDRGPSVARILYWQQ